MSFSDITEMFLRALLQSLAGFLIIAAALALIGAALALIYEFGVWIVLVIPAVLLCYCAGQPLMKDIP